MKVLKYIFLFFISIIILIIEYYYDQNKYYPSSLIVLPIASNKEFISYYKDGILRYSISLSKNKPMYQLVWVFSGPFTKEGSPHSFSWSGKQCGNDKAFLNLMSQDATPDADGCFEIDLH